MRTFPRNMMNPTVATLAIVILLPQPLPARDRHDWGNVQRLTSDTDIIVHSKAGASWRGAFVNAMADSLTLVIDDSGSRRRIGIARDEVREVRKKWSRFSSGLLGAGIGAAIGGAIGGGVEERNKTNEDQGVALAVFLLLGTLIGFTVGHHTNIGSTQVYVAP